MTLARCAEELSSPRRWLAFAGIMGPYLFYAYCWNSENFLRPYLAETLALSRQQVSGLYSAQALGSLFGAVLLSQLADRHGRRLTYAVTSGCFGLVAVGALAVAGYASALLQRFVMGFFMGGVFGCAVSLYVGLFPVALRGLVAGLVQLVYNGGDAVLAWCGGHSVSWGWRTVMVVGGCGAILTGLAAYALIPDDRRVRPWGSMQTAPKPTPPRLTDLFVAGRWRLTMRLAALCGLNFLAFLSFNGWLSTYLKETQALPAEAVGNLLAVVHVGSMAGAIAWGLAADRYGRRFNAWGFAAAAALIVMYLCIPTPGLTLVIVGFGYGFCFVASGIWGPYFTELYPENLRATAASIFNWGRVMSLFGAVGSGAIAQHYGLIPAMAIGAIFFGIAALLWRSLPETLKPTQAAELAK